MYTYKTVQLYWNEEAFSFTVKTAICPTDIDGYMLYNYMSYMIICYMKQTHNPK